MSVEFWCLYGAMLLALVHVAAASFAFKAQVGNRYTVGPRDDDVRPTGFAGRMERAQRNFLETFAVFAAAVFMIEFLDVAGGLSRFGAILYIAGRLAYLPLYSAGIPWLRTFAWNAATLGLALMILQIGIAMMTVAPTL